MHGWCTPMNAMIVAISDLLNWCHAGWAEPEFVHVYDFDVYHAHTEHCTRCKQQIDESITSTTKREFVVCNVEECNLNSLISNW